MTRRAWAIVALSAGFVVGYVAAAHADDAVPLFHGAEQTGASTVAKIAKEHALADQGNARLLVVAADSTDNWGCDCPPFVYEPYGSSADDPIAYFYPVVASGPDPGAFLAAPLAGTYRFTGRFTKDKVDYDGWLDRRKVKHARTRGELFGVKRRVFAVAHWCFDKVEDPAIDAYADVLARMKKAGVTFCK